MSLSGQQLPPSLPPLDTVPDPESLCSIEDLTGFDLQAIRKAIGKPLIAALDENDEAGMFAWYWRAMIRNGRPTLSFDEVMDEPFRVVVEAFAEANGGGTDPMTARSGNS